MAKAAKALAVPHRTDGSDGYSAKQLFCNSQGACGYSYDDIVLLPGMYVCVCVWVCMVVYLYCG